MMHFSSSKHVSKRRKSPIIGDGFLMLLVMMKILYWRWKNWKTVWKHISALSANDFTLRTKYCTDIGFIFDVKLTKQVQSKNDHCMSWLAYAKCYQAQLLLHWSAVWLTILTATLRFLSWRTINEMWLNII